MLAFTKYQKQPCTLSDCPRSQIYISSSITGSYFMPGWEVTIEICQAHIVSLCHLSTTRSAGYCTLTTGITIFRIIPRAILLLAAVCPPAPEPCLPDGSCIIKMLTHSRTLTLSQQWKTSGQPRGSLRPPCDTRCLQVPVEPRHSCYCQAEHTVVLNWSRFPNTSLTSHKGVVKNILHVTLTFIYNMWKLFPLP